MDLFKRNGSSSIIKGIKGIKDQVSTMRFCLGKHSGGYGQTHL